MAVERRARKPWPPAALGALGCILGACSGGASTLSSGNGTAGPDRDASGNSQATTPAGSDAASTATHAADDDAESAVTGAGDGDGPGDGGACTTDPLRTGLIAQQTGVSVDAFDCEILTWTAWYGEPDPMIFKAIIYVESRFDETAVACANMPCGTPSGWAAAESGCYGLMQVVPACGDDPNDAGLMSNGQPDLTTDMSQTGWAGSIFNPSVNIEIGIAGIAGNRAQVEKQFPGCTVDQYTMMAVGNYNDYGSTKSCTEYNTTYDDAVVMAYDEYATAAGYPAHSY